jgi:hypothetical protein
MRIALQRRTPALLSALVLAAAILAMSTGNAEARLFEPQHDWWNAGRTCVGSRNPPGRRWQALPPRSCRIARATNVMLSTTSDAVADKFEFADAKQPADAMYVAFAPPPQKIEALAGG